MSVVRSYNQSNGVAITDAPAQVVRLFDRGVLVVGGGGGGAVDSVNGETGTVVLSAADVGAVPTTRTINGDALSANVTLTASDVGAATTAQGSLADSATQPGDLATVATTGVYSDLTGKPTLGTAAAAATGDFDAAGAAAASQAASQPLDSDLTAIAALTTTTFGRALLALADAAALRTAGGLGTAATSASTDFQPIDSDLTSIAALITTSYGRAFLELANQAALVALLPSYQPLDSDLTSIAALTTTSYGRAVLELANQAALMALLSASSTTASGIVELATTAETQTGTDAVRAVTPAGGAATYQPLDSDLTAIAALSTTSYGRAFLALADQAALMALLSASSTSASGIVELATSAETTTGTDTVRATTPAGVKAVSDTLQPLDSDLTTIAGLTATTDNFLQSKSSAWASRTPTQVAADLALPIAAQAHTVNTQTGTSYTLVLTDAGKFVTMSNASASTLTVPPNSSVAFAVGTMLDGAQLGAGQVTLTAGAGVTINATPGLKIAAQYGTFGLLKTATDTWLAYGRLSA